MIAGAGAGPRRPAVLPGSDNEQTMSDAEGGRARRPFGSRRAPGFGVSAGFLVAPVRRALAERFVAHIDAGRVAPFAHRAAVTRRPKMR